MKGMQVLELLNKHDIILASKSPRRQNLLRELGIKFRIATDTDFNEDYPTELKAQEIPLHIARKKAAHFKDILNEQSVLITADTIVWFENGVVPKPRDTAEAKSMLKRLSGNKHEVFTGVTIRSVFKETGFFSRTCVYFKELTEAEINYYVDHYRPLDKAGGYGIQEWIGYVGVEKIEGCFYNVMGLPVQQLFFELVVFIR